MGALDVGLVYDYPLAPRQLADAHVIELDEAPWQLVTPAGWGAAVSLEELAHRHWFVGLDVPDGEHAVRTLCAQAGFDPRSGCAAPTTTWCSGPWRPGSGSAWCRGSPWKPPAGVLVRPMREAGATRLTVAVHLRRAGTPRAAGGGAGASRGRPTLPGDSHRENFCGSRRRAARNSRSV